MSYTCDSAVIGWGPPEDEGGGIVSFTCTISGPGDSSVTVPNCNSPFTIDNITVNTDYTVSVTATNCAGVNTSTIPIRIDGKGTYALSFFLHDIICERYSIVIPYWLYQLATLIIRKIVFLDATISTIILC